MPRGLGVERREGGGVDDGVVVSWVASDFCGVCVAEVCEAAGVLGR